MSIRKAKYLIPNFPFFTEAFPFLISLGIDGTLY
jgi:hypothetical protein